MDGMVALARFVKPGPSEKDRRGVITFTENGVKHFKAGAVYQLNLVMGVMTISEVGSSCVRPEDTLGRAVGELCTSSILMTAAEVERDERIITERTRNGVY